MFWGISLEVGKRYSQTVEKSFHISMAALNASNAVKGSVTVMVEVEKACYPLCTLHADRIPQQALDYIFTEGEEVLFYTEGNIDVHLTGYLIDDPNPVEYSTDEEEGSAANSNASGSEEENNEQSQTRKKKSKRRSSEEENLKSLISELDDLNEDNEGNIDLWLPRSARKKQSSGGFVETSEMQTNLTGKLLDNDSEDSEEDDEWQPGGKRKLSRKKGRDEAEESGSKEKKIKNNSSHMDGKNNTTKSKNSKYSTPDKMFLSPNFSKSKKKSLNEKEVNSCDGHRETESSGDISVDRNRSQDEKSPLSEETRNKMESANVEEKSHHDKKELPGGIVVEDIVKGQGKKAKKGKELTLHYKGILKKSKKQFDASVGSKPYTFRLGKGEAIYKDWDVALEGMHVGGKRRLIIPPSSSYGSNQMESSIPANSTLVFEVELLKVH